MLEADSRHVRLLFDTAHFQQGGGDPARRFGSIASGSRVPHLKDVRAIESAPGYQFVELGRGRWIAGRLQTHWP